MENLSTRPRLVRRLALVLSAIALFAFAPGLATAAHAGKAPAAAAAADPTADIRHTRAITHVVKRGRVYARAARRVTP